MSTDAVTLFLALLAIAAQALVAVTLIVTAAGMAAAWSDRRARFVALVGRDAELLALAIAVTATAGSLYLSEVAHFTPCRLCWIQRACMYPLVVLLGSLRIRRVAAISRLCLALAAVGASVSTYHVVLERFPQLETDICAIDNPCTLIWVDRFGYLTIPTMALSGFTGIIALLALRWRCDRRDLGAT